MMRNSDLEIHKITKNEIGNGQIKSETSYLNQNNIAQRLVSNSLTCCFPSYKTHHSHQESSDPFLHIHFCIQIDSLKGQNYNNRHCKNVNKLHSLPNMGELGNISAICNKNNPSLKQSLQMF